MTTWHSILPTARGTVTTCIFQQSTYFFLYSRPSGSTPPPKHQCKLSAHPALRQQMRCKSLASKLKLYNRYFINVQQIVVLKVSFHYYSQATEWNGDILPLKSSDVAGLGKWTKARGWKPEGRSELFLPDCFHSWLANASTLFLLWSTPLSFIERNFFGFVDFRPAALHDRLGFQG